MGENRTVTISAYKNIENATLIVASYSEGALVAIDFNETLSISKGEMLTYTVNHEFKKLWVEMLRLCSGKTLKVQFRCVRIKK